MDERSQLEKARAGDLHAVRWLALPSHADDRGILTVVEGGSDVPFEIKRVYSLHHIRQDRGGHAHRDTTQLIIAAAGSCRLSLSNGRETQAFVLDDPCRGLLLGPMLFIRLQDFSADAALTVLASTHYEKRRSIYSWEHYLETIRE